MGKPRKSRVPSLVGQTFGRWTVVEKAERGKWWCRCSCEAGTMSRVPGSELRKGNARSCGCLRQEMREASKLHLDGQTFGKWTVIRRGQSTGTWLCQCACGQSEPREVKQYSLTAGLSVSCGCSARDKKREKLIKEMVGKTFGRLTVVEWAYAEGGQNWWRCRCECGQEKLTTTDRLQGGLTASCGCLQKEMRASYGWTAEILDMTGHRFERLLVLELAGRSKAKQARWKCLCDCGNITYAVGGALRSGEVRSCGCLRRDVNRAMMTTHGMSFSPCYVTWQSMLDRALNKNNPQYKDYGGRGIKVCARWRESFLNFYEDMGERHEEHSLDRIDVNGNYSCGKCEECLANGWTANCRWATREQQAWNRTDTIYLTHNGETLAIGEWAKRLGLPRSLLYMRYCVRGWSAADTLSGERTEEALPDAEHAYKNQARIAVNLALEQGRLTRPPTCERPGCTRKAEEAHHHKGYEPENWLTVRWLCATCHYHEHSDVIEFNGRELTVKEWAQELGLTTASLRSRLVSPNWTKEEALTTPKLRSGNARNKLNGKRKKRKTGKRQDDAARLAEQRRLENAG